ncbi:MAG: hypothetical protein LBH51_08795 [Treponema sp.]|nr:hypothetical protein [Treponema sp.]
MRASESIPGEYRRIAEKLFPSRGFLPGEGLDKAAAEAFAGILGIEADYKRLLSVNETSEEMNHFLAHFQNNLDLLIQKTWIEKADEDRKAKLEARVPPFIQDVREGKFQKALRDFGVILEELAYLFFGAQSTREDFTEYALRIDIQMGLFWWYGGQLGSLSPREPGENTAGNEILWSVLLIGLCFLTNF